MKRIRIFHTADWHLDQSNLDFTVPAIERAINAAEYDLFVFAGDIAVHRGHVHPNVAWEARRLIQMGTSKAKLGGIFVAGNHDLSFVEGVKGMGPGILAGQDASTSDSVNLRIIETPETFTVGVNDTQGITFAAIPSVTKFQLAHLKANSNEEADAEKLLHLMTRSHSAVANDQSVNGPVIALYHGTVGGARLGNEMVMRSGIDISLPAHAFRDFDDVYAGHIHNRQIMQSGSGPSIYYPGAPAPLTWNDKLLEPAVYIHVYEFDGKSNYKKVETITHSVDVVSQMIDLTVEVYMDKAGIRDVLMGPHGLEGKVEPGARVRVKVVGPSQCLADLTPQVHQEIEQVLELRSLKIIPHQTDAARVRVAADGEDLTIEDMFVHWAEISGHDEATTKRVLKHISEVESMIVDQHIDAQYECKPIRISARNWCQYEKVSLPFDELGKVTSISGPNVAGKSNLSRIFLFSRYKKQESGDKLADLIRNGTDWMDTTEVFESHGQRYMINRRLKRKANGGASSELFFYVWNNEKWDVAIEGTAAETQELIESLIGPSSLFLATTFAGQNDVDGLVDLSPSDTKDLLLSVLQRDFDARVNIAKEVILKLERDRDVLVAQSSKAEELEAREESLSADRETLVDARRYHEEMMDKCPSVEGARAEVESFRAKTVELADVNKRLDELRIDIGGAAENLEEKNKDMAAIDKAESELAMVNIDLATSDKYAVSVEEQTEKLGIASRDRDDFALSVADVNDQLINFERGASSVSQRFVKAFQELAGKVESVSAALFDARERAELIDDVPCGGEEWHDEGREVDMGKCKFLVSAIEGKKNIPTLEEQLAENIKARDVAKRQCEVLEETDNFNRVHLRDQLGRLTKELDRKKQVEEGIRKVIEAASVRESAASKLREKRARLKAILSTFQNALLALEAAQTRFDSLRDRRIKTERLLESLQGVADGLRDAEHRLADAEREVAAVQQLMDANSREMASVEGKLEELRLMIDKFKGDREKASGIVSLIREWRIVRDALHRDGIPYLMLEDFAIPRMRELVNFYLKHTDMSVSVDSERDLVSGKARNDVVIWFSDHRGKHPLSAASGFQRTAIGIAMRNAVADLHAAATGSTIWLSIQDEGFGTMDTANLDRAKATIRTIAERRGWFVFISHVPGMNEMADTLITVSDDGGTSSIDVE